MSDPRSKLKIEVNKRRNRLYCAWVGHVSKDDLEEIFTDLRKAVAELKPNFSMINDLTQINYGQNAAIPVLVQIMQYLINHGMKDIVRVVNNKSVIHTQMSNLSLKQQGYIPVYVNSMEEAEKYLEEGATRKHLRIKLRNKAIELKYREQIYQGSLVNLSLGGCSIQSDAVALSLGDEVKLIFSMPDEQKMDTQFVLNAEVVRISEDGMAVNFKATMPSVLKKLTECMAECLIQ